ncbi:outer membrane protein [Microvirga alba]|uniref:Porin family protein n=1 Tax=Microvirga alba TaxID=2791025 RepID=A0A931FR79_9HYPH|nr:outer membrane beta-barrel protein [Microvirga alba]MBF9232491.1 porin family protein [Microvirga alba]
MKKVLLSSVALLSLTAGAMAADLPSRRAAPVPVVAVVPAFSWTGFYLGANAGYGWNTSNDKVFVNGLGLVGGNNRGGFVGGGQIGYNYQMGMFVVGVETDLQYADLGGRDNSVLFLNPALVGFRKNSSDNYFGTVRARAGVAFDRALVYATGGFAYGDVGGNSFGGSSNGGWTLGGGVEYAFTNNLTAKVEGLYVNLDRKSNNAVILGLNNLGAVNNKNNEFGVVRVGVNYKFNSY